MQKVTIAIPTYNRSKYLPHAIESVLKQTYSNFDLLVVDNASTDNTREIMSSIRDKRIKYYRNELNIGMIGNWNRCLELAQTEIVWILHSDDLLTPFALELVVNAYNDSKAAMIFGGYRNFTQVNGEEIKGEINTTPLFWEYQAGKAAIEKVIKEGIMCSTVSIRKSVFEAIGGFDHQFSYSGDEEYWLRIAKQYDIVYMDNVLAFYRRHSEHTMLETWKRDDFYKQYSLLNSYREKYAREAKVSDDVLNEIVQYPVSSIVYTVLPNLIIYKEKRLAQKYLEIFRNAIQINKTSERILRRYKLLELVIKLPPIISSNLFKFILTLKNGKKRGGI